MCCKFGVLVMIYRLQTFLWQHSLTSGAILSFQCQNLLIYLFFFHLYKSNSQLRVDLKGNIYYYANMNPVDPQKENRFIILLVCLVKHCSQKCHIFYVPSMSALWLSLPYQLNKSMLTLAQRIGRVMKNSPLYMVNCFMRCTFMLLSSDSAKYMLSFIPKSAKYMFVCSYKVIAGMRVKHTTKCLAWK